MFTKTFIPMAALGAMGFCFSPENNGGGEGGNPKDPAAGADDKTKTDEKPTNKGKEGGSGGEEENEDLTDEEFEALPKKVKDRIQKERDTAATKAIDDHKKEVDKAAKDAETENRRKKIKETTDLTEQNKLLTTQVDDLTKQITDLTKELNTTKDRDVRLQACEKAKIDPKYASRLMGNDLDSYIRDAKEFAKEFPNGATKPNLEGGNNNQKGSPEKQKESNKSTLKGVIGSGF